MPKETFLPKYIVLKKVYMVHVWADLVAALCLGIYQKVLVCRKNKPENSEGTSNMYDANCISCQ